ncbi:MAG: hypothetical protein QNJ90_14290, partial [Planctomycetota bacterium]|nr:hypothetical protein [Planctomycetota bacterium]
PVVGDLMHLLALRMPAAGAKASSVKLDWHPQETAPMRIRGKVAIDDIGPRVVKLSGTYTFKSRGKSHRKDRWWYDRGEATTELEFDAKEGVVRTARIVWSYQRENLKRSGPAAVSKSSGTYELRLQEIIRARATDFQTRVDTAIEGGLKHLRTLQEKDGTFKPHGGYTIGTTALGVLTLVACGVPRDDPAVKKSLDWLFEQEPEKTYDRAVSLMAIDRAWTPQAELDAEARGRPVDRYVRNLPPRRMAWARRVAERLEKTATSPGSWGYPPGGRSLLTFDTSNTQYAVLGLRAATRLGYEVREQTWLGVIRHFSVVMERKGPKGEVSIVREGQAVPDEKTAHLLHLRGVPKVVGFRYSTLESHDHVDGALTCGAIACLLIARHQLKALGSRKWNPKLAKQVDEMLACGWAWMQANWRLDRHPGLPSNSWYWYFLYSLERAGVLAEVKRLGGCDWYYEGALQLLMRQSVEEKTVGAWPEKGADATPPTCFALLFLKRGTRRLPPAVTGR